MTASNHVAEIMRWQFAHEREPNTQALSNRRPKYTSFIKILFAILHAPYSSFLPDRIKSEVNICIYDNTGCCHSWLRSLAIMHSPLGYEEASVRAQKATQRTSSKLLWCTEIVQTSVRLIGSLNHYRWVTSLTIKIWQMQTMRRKRELLEVTTSSRPTNSGCFLNWSMSWFHSATDSTRPRWKTKLRRLR